MRKMKKLLSLLLACAMVFGLSVTASAADQPTLTVGSATVEPGATVEIPISISDNTGIAGMHLTVTLGDGLDFPTAYAQGDALSKLTLTPPAFLYVPDPDDSEDFDPSQSVPTNPFNFVFDNTTNDKTNGVILTLTFTAPKKIGTYAIEISATMAKSSGASVTPDIVNGSITVASSQTAPTCSVSAAKGSSSKQIAMTGSFDDYANLSNYYEVTGHGLVYITAARLGYNTLTVGTSGRTKVTFSAYKTDGSFTYTMKAASTTTRYVVRSWLSYVDPTTNQTVYVYSDPLTVSYKTV